MKKNKTMKTEKRELDEQDNRMITDVIFRLNKLKDKGYHIRFTGSMLISDSWVNCDCCDRRTKVKIGYEANYPENPDIGLCSMCSDELIDLGGG